MNGKTSKCCHFCQVFNRKWKWQEPVVGYIALYTTYPKTMDYPICWKCCVLWQKVYQAKTGKKNMNWLYSYGELERKKMFKNG